MRVVLVVDTDFEQVVYRSLELEVELDAHFALVLVLVLEAFVVEVRDVHFAQVRHVLLASVEVEQHLVVVELPVLGVGEVKDILLRPDHDLRDHFEHPVLVPTEAEEHLA